MNQYSEREKLDLFTSLFRGRTDVFAIRWEKMDKSGYMPAYYDDQAPEQHVSSCLLTPGAGAGGCEQHRWKIPHGQWGQDCEWVRGACLPFDILPPVRISSRLLNYSKRGICIFILLMNHSEKDGQHAQKLHMRKQKQCYSAIISCLHSPSLYQDEEITFCNDFRKTQRNTTKRGKHWYWV